MWEAEVTTKWPRMSWPASYDDGDLLVEGETVPVDVDHRARRG